jgi:hypothetical protein
VAGYSPYAERVLRFVSVRLRNTRFSDLKSDDRDDYRTVTVNERISLQQTSRCEIIADAIPSTIPIKKHILHCIMIRVLIVTLRGRVLTSGSAIRANTYLSFPFVHRFQLFYSACGQAFETDDLYSITGEVLHPFRVTPRNILKYANFIIIKINTRIENRIFSLTAKQRRYASVQV